MTLDDLLSALRRHRWAALLASTLVLLLAVAAAALPADRYTATATVIAKPADATDVASYSSAVSVLVPTLAAYATSEANDALVRGSLPSDLADADVEIEARAEPGTGLLTITATSARQDAAARFANAASFALRVKQARDLAGLRLTVLDDAVTPTVPSGPPRAAARCSAASSCPPSPGSRRRCSPVPCPRGPSWPTWCPAAPASPSSASCRACAWVAGPRCATRRTPASSRRCSGCASASRARGPPAPTSRWPSPRVHASEGKSSLSAALVQALAVAGQQVVLVDADLRRPTQHTQFEAALTPGLAEAAVLEPAGLLQRTDEPTLRLLSAGVPDRHPLEVLDAALPRALAAARTRKAFALVDTPPWSPSPRPCASSPWRSAPCSWPTPVAWTSPSSRRRWRACARRTSSSSGWS